MSDHKSAYQLLKNGDPVALGSIDHCLDVFYWEIYYGNDHLQYKIILFEENVWYETSSKNIANYSFIWIS